MISTASCCGSSPGRLHALFAIAAPQPGVCNLTVRRRIDALVERDLVMQDTPRGPFRITDAGLSFFVQTRRSYG